MKKTVGRMSPEQKLVVATVGLADLTDEANIANIRKSLKAQIPEQFHDETLREVKRS